MGRVDFRKSGLCVLCIVRSQTARVHGQFNKGVNLGRRKLGNSLGSFTDSVLGKLTRKHETDSRLDFPRAQSSLLVVSGQLSSLIGNALENVVNERVHDRHTLLGDTGIGVDLLEDTVDVSSVGFGTLLVLLGASSGLLGGLLGGLLAVVGVEGRRTV